ncbi:YaiO family outer membrane beta-barrel protein [Maribacter sp. SA7]|uniref:YaiO family outer membrane beta-barrel protein n=1 Tax=Maribacter zhoushanensis TaxID=3030012 RepID=UPI0023ED4385|nr:YaiO family outer membrane beta-barrel protein [Maribacter zhoushanensis]MDF4203119.1 YaiO family outer membrane beta-barrel protein [Maribacter zhoushanensis]
MKNSYLHMVLLVLSSFILKVNGQDINSAVPSFETAYALAYEGKTNTAHNMLYNLVNAAETEIQTSVLWASTLSWRGDYDLARSEFNSILSKDKTNREAWLSAVKNELYTKNYATALGLANKALVHIENDQELKRLQTVATDGVHGTAYNPDGWFNVESKVNTKFTDAKNSSSSVNDAAIAETENIHTTPVTEEKLKNTVMVNSAVTFFDKRFDPITTSSISYKRQTPFGAIIPRINNSNRVGKNGIQLDLDLYPKIAKGFYAYINYGYSESESYPNHKVGGDVYYNHKSGIEFSAGGRLINFATKDVKSITNSLGYYTGNYYLSLRSYITPESNNLTNVSGNLLVRKYLKDAKNYMGLNVGYGFSPELRQFTSGDQLLAETLLYIESQRLSFEYQFTSKNNLSAYRTNVGVLRQEQSFDPGSYFYSISAGLTYEFNF